MKVVEYTEAINEMFTLLDVAIKTQAASVIGYVPHIMWPGIEEDTRLDHSKYYVRMTQKGIDEPQTAFCGDVDRLYEPFGLLIIQLFTPKSQELGLTKGRELSSIIKKAYRGKTTPGRIWFRNVSVRELKPELNYYRFNIVVQYEYNEKG